MLTTSRSLLLLLISISYNTFGENSNQDYRITRKIAQNIFMDHRETLYCACSYNKHGEINNSSCSLNPKKYTRRATKMEFEHMMPMENAGRHLNCWKNKICVNKQGQRYRGRACCRKISPEFRKMENELLNLWPSVGSINQARSNFRFTEFSEQEKARLGKLDNCDFWLDKAAKKVESRDVVKGIVARANLFMADKYSITLSKQQRKLLEIWNKKYPSTAWEITWNNKIKQIQGYGNNRICD